MDERNRIYLQRIADDKRLLEALKQELLNSVNANDLESGNKSNENLGAEIRALLQARELVVKGIDKIKLLQTQKQGREKQNPVI